MRGPIEVSVSVQDRVVADAPSTSTGVGIAGSEGDRQRASGARTDGPQALVRIGRTGERRRGDGRRPDGFVDGGMPIGKVLAMARYLLRIRVVVRPGLVLLTPAPAASAKGGAADPTALPAVKVARADGFEKRLGATIRVTTGLSGRHH